MRDLKNTGSNDRLSAQKDAKQALLARFKPKPTVQDPEFEKLAEKRAAEKEAIRQQHELAKAELRREKAEKDAARLAAEMAALDQSRDLECLTQAVYYEARGEGRDGMKAVAQVVLNRARHPAFPKTVCAVVYQGANRGSGCQFSFTCNGAMRGAVNRSAWNRAREVATKALSGQVFSAVGNATPFHTTAVSASWSKHLIRVN